MSEIFNILELFSGIGGMHFAFKQSGANGEVKAAIDINPIANNVYKYNNPKTKLYNKNIQGVDKKFIEKLSINMILMSPPCQPFTRVGKRKDLCDNRTDALKHLCNLIPELDTVEYILMENVKGFEKSEARNLYIDVISQAKFFYREFIISPSQLGIPNTRHRYFCIARRNKDFNFDNKLWDCLPNNINFNAPFNIEKILEPEDNIPINMILSDDLLAKRVMLLDIVNMRSTNSICFTKAYTHYSEGTGSVFSPLKDNEIENIFNKAKTIDNTQKEYLEIIKTLKLRYFTPRETLRLMCFPEDFEFPKDITDKQKYRLLGNSVNILVVSELIKLLISN